MTILDIVQRLRSDWYGKPSDAVLDFVMEEAASEIERLRKRVAKLEDDRKKIDRRIHNQRIANRENWEIVEMRRKWLGSDTARQGYVRMLKTLREMRDAKS